MFLKNPKSKKELMTNDYRLQTSHGFAILFAVLIGSAVLAISLGIASVASKEISLSAIAKEGGKALFAADTGIECGLYNDVNLGAFVAGQQSGDITCGGETLGTTGEIQGIPDSYFEFRKTLDDLCTIVRVYKSISIPTDQTGTTYTRVEALGYNHPCDVLISGNPTPNNLVERALRATYPNIGGGNNLQQPQPMIISPGSQPTIQTGQVNSQNISNTQILQPQQIQSQVQQQVQNSSPTSNTTTNVKAQ